MQTPVITHGLPLLAASLGYSWPSVRTHGNQMSPTVFQNTMQTPRLFSNFPWSVGAGMPHSWLSRTFHMRSNVNLEHERLLLPYELENFQLGNLSQFMATNSGVHMPRFLYGTAWCKDSTEDLVVSAVRAGFQGIDTANTHYFRYDEVGVGKGLESLFASGIARDSLFIQTKVNPDYAKELNPDVPIAKQVELSIARSLSNLRLEFIDSLLLHMPYQSHEQTMEAWRAMEKAARAGSVRHLGISNLVSLKQLRKVYKHAKLKPTIVRQPFYAETGFESEMRAWCAKKGIHFQSFWTITGNKRIIVSKTMQELAGKYGVAPHALFFRFVMGLGVAPLTGTSKREHMKLDISSLHVPLTVQDAERIDKLLIEEVEKAHDLEEEVEADSADEAEETSSTVQEGHVEDVFSEEDLDGILQQSSRVVVEVDSSNCRLCTVFAAKYRRMAVEYFPIRFLRVTGDENDMTHHLVKKRLRAKGAPTFIFFHNGKVMATETGGCEADVRANLQKLMVKS
eukprot:gnl/MRDRNA2_/MRDRNA2_110637_c0_seq1.p1 gnl/MRDRNA2_/MRDRNA2_110637_c0~~gnl/MRDRNA2_/MRDRNA2_110637_c0_seq1.p1  ORF type:complete len:541 (+),score=96.09 gnl/MRDRNA2_/MRDRNA2_110637_c0_seq1:96-1625(+)